MNLSDLLNVEDWFQRSCIVLAIVMLIWNTVEVGRNDAANLVNAVFGSRVLRRKRAVFVAGCAVVAGAVMSSDVIDTARKGIFNPAGLDSLEAALSIFVAVYIVNTVLLYSYSAFGMPVSTTACLVFALLGGALALDPSSVNQGKAGYVLLGILCSIVFSGIASFFVQRAARGAIRDRTTHLATLLLHGGWIAGGMVTALCYFLLLKGMKHVTWVKLFNEKIKAVNEEAAGIGSLIVVIVLWGTSAIFIHLMLVAFRKKAAKLLFPVLAVLGMIAMAFAFGQNDLANCASPGLAILTLLSHPGEKLNMTAHIPWWALLGCGLLLFAGMTTESAERVTKAEVEMGSMGDHVALWAPNWCLRLAGKMLRFRGEGPALAPRVQISSTGKTKHYDALRACVIMSVSASVIATASSLALPVSTTYVAFAAVIATGMADRIFQRGDATLKLGRSIWVVTSWVLSALIAALATGLVALAVYHLEITGIVLALVLNLIIRKILKRRADRQARRVEEEALEREEPDRFAPESED